MSTHLKPEQFDDLLLGIAGGETTAHVSACPQCRSEIERVRGSLASFRGAAVSWSEGAARLVTPPSQRRARAMWARPAWALATAAILLAIVIPISVRRAQNKKANAAADAQAQISRDNQLLAHIDSEIDETTPAPLQPLQANR